MPFRRDSRNFKLSRDKPIAILSDLHGNADAFRAAISQIQKLRDQSGVQELVILGDLFTYGCQPRAIVDEVFELANTFDVWLIIGNHDEFYFDSLATGQDNTHTKPDWIRETIEWTRQQLAGGHLDELGQRHIWHESLATDDVLLSHANPFSARDWTYLNGKEERQRAIDALAMRDFRVGIFGHTHRRCAITVDDGGNLKSLDALLSRDKIALDESKWLLNPGSVGQPRHRKPMSSFLLLQRSDRGLAASFEPIRYDVQRHIDCIHQASLSKATKKRLIDYLQPNS